jgi:hypothetical protein
MRVTLNPGIPGKERPAYIANSNSLILLILFSK